jgi:hypothetical protein
MHDLEEQLKDYIGVPQLRAVRKVLVQLLMIRTTRILATIRSRTVIDVTDAMASRGQRGWVAIRGRDGEEWTVVLSRDSVVEDGHEVPADEHTAASSRGSETS